MGLAQILNGFVFQFRPINKYSVEAKSSIQAVIEKSHGLADTSVFPIQGPIGVVYYAMFGAGGQCRRWRKLRFSRIFYVMSP